MAKKIMSRGVGESRINRDPALEIDRRTPLLGLHFNGIAAEDIPEESLIFLSVEKADENQRDDGPRVEVLRDGSRPQRARSMAGDVDRHIQERGDFLTDESNEQYAAPDQRADLVRQHIPEGMRPRFLSEKKLNGGRDARGFEVVKDENGDVVRHGTSILGQMPETKARERSRRIQKVGNDLLEQVYAQGNPGDGEAKYVSPEKIISNRR